MEAKVKIGRMTLEMADPTFGYSTSHTAHIPVTNPTPEGFSYSLSIYLALSEDGPHVAEDTILFSLAGGASSTKNITLLMPDFSGGPYYVYVDISVEGTVIAQFVGTETVMVEVTPDVDIGPITWD